MGMGRSSTEELAPIPACNPTMNSDREADCHWGRGAVTGCGCPNGTGPCSDGLAISTRSAPTSSEC
jgi:hypothetical protein